MTRPAGDPASASHHYDPAILSTLDPATAHRLLAASAYLYRERYTLRTTGALFHQGRTLGLLDGYATSISDRIARHPCGRFLVKAGCGELDALARHLEQAGLCVDADLVTLTADADDFRARDGVGADHVARPRGSVEVASLDSDPHLIRGVQALQIRRGLMPMPAWFLRGDGAASTSLAWIDDHRDIIAAGVVQSLPPIAGRWRRPALASGICVRDRGRGWGSHVNAALLSLAIDRFDADGLIEIVESGNRASLRMNAATGLHRDAEIGFLYAETAASLAQRQTRLGKTLVGPAGLEPAT